MFKDRKRQISDDSSCTAIYEEFKRYSNLSNKRSHRLRWFATMGAVLATMLSLSLGAVAGSTNGIVVTKGIDELSPKVYESFSIDTSYNNIKKYTPERQWEARVEELALNVPDNVTPLEFENESLYASKTAEAVETAETSRENRLRTILEKGDILEMPEMSEAPEMLDISGVSIDMSETQIYIIPGISSEEGNGLIPAGISAEGPGEEYVYIVSERDKLRLAKIVYLECRGQPLVGQVAVVAVILNRYAMGYHGNATLKGVMEEFGTYSRIDSVSRADLEAHPNCMLAVELALRGWDPTRTLFPEKGAKYFYAPDETCDYELSRRDKSAKIVIEDHVFHNYIGK